jgi:hypothetical protein
MNEVACAHEACTCAISSASPDPFCSDVCRNESGKRGRCHCDHPDCGGIEGQGEANAPSALYEERIGNRER